MKGRSPLWTRFRRNRFALFGLAVVAVFFFLALLGPWLAPFDPLKPSPEAMLASPGARHWLGADQFGRDILSRIIHGARISLKVAVLAVAIAFFAGGGAGLTAGYLGGWTDELLSRFNDVLFSFPDILLALVVMAVFQEPSQMNVMLALGIVYTPIFARIARGAAMQVKNMAFIEAARALGAGRLRIMLRHVAPNMIPPMLVQTSLSLAFAILGEAALSFLGLGVEADAPSWGIMLSDGKDWMERAWWVAVFPGMAITLVVLGFNLLGDGLRDALDPRAAA
jgi:peptide/nickel transport system permease protein